MFATTFLRVRNAELQSSEHSSRDVDFRYRRFDSRSHRPMDEYDENAFCDPMQDSMIRSEHYAVAIKDCGRNLAS